MSPDLPSVRLIFDSAVELPPGAERTAYLDKACAGGPEIRRRVEALLEAYEDAGSFLEPPAGGAVPTVLTPERESLGMRIGPYKLLQQIGEGGMGTVYMADQVEPVARRVALKIIKPGMDSRQVIVRFEAERQALALMDHPNIAKMLDAGTTDEGRPYFVMELVKGVSVIQYCDDNRLDIAERLKLFVSICQAVQHAHQKGIIHRDLKPSNVLVADYDNRPVVKIIDFGVAKAVGQSLVERTMFTEFGQIVGTIEYMSPEQAKLNQLDIDTRTDIYSLGVLLYELLTGETPHDKGRLRSAAFDEVLRIIREEEPPRPSTRLSSNQSLASIAANRHIEPKKLTTLMAGDLDWIVMRALDKERTRRYESATGLAEDIQRYLADEPVLAHRPTKFYRLRKFYRRNRLALVASAAVAAVVVGAAIASTALYLRERAAKSTAIAAQETARSEADRSQLLVFKLGNRLWSQGDALMESGHRPEANQIFTEALNTFEQAVKDFPDVADYRRSHAIAELKLGGLLQSDRRIEEAEPHLRNSIRELGALKTEFPNDASYPTLAAEEINSTIVLADAFLNNGHPEEASQTFREAVRLLRTSAEKGDRDSQDRLGGLYLNGKGVDKDYSEALKWLRRAADQGNKISQNSVGLMYDQGRGVPADPAEAAKWYRRSIDQGYNEPKVWLARLYSEGRGVEKDLQKASALYHEAAQPFHKILMGWDVSTVNQLAWDLATNENPSVQDPDTAVELAQKAVALEPNDGGIWNTLGVAQYRAGNWQAAVKALNQAMALRKGGDPYDYFFLAMAQQKSGHPDEARKWYDKALEWMKAKAPRDKELIRFRAEAAETLGLSPPEKSQPDHPSSAAKSAGNSAE
ncbi:MAG TPA: protein kinase [Lacipirellulaceae bacterium]|jgi:serine/threonine protein kinase/TPR repeat protein|nr:protein kinase [Lacipirellulaceae bacterium]